MSAENSAREIIKNFTRARKFPQLIGRTPDGKRIVGGPYTLPQALGGAAVGGVLWLLFPLWAGGIVWNVGFFCGAVGLTVFLLGKLRLGGRSPASVMQGIGRALVAPEEAKINGRSVSPRQPRLVRSGGYITATPTSVAAMRCDAPVPAPANVAAAGPQMRTVDTTTTSTIPRGSHPSPLNPPLTGPPAPVPSSRPAARSSVKELLALAAASSE